MNASSHDYQPIETSSDYDTIVQLRYEHMSPSLRTFQAYANPVVLKKGQGQYLWDVDDKKYVDLMSQNLCISVGYNHPLVTREAKNQIDQLGHCTTMYFNAASSHFAEELAARMPDTADWVVHFVNSGAEAIDLAQLMARLYTGNFELIALRNAYHGLHFSAMSLTGIQTCHHAVPVSSGILHVHNPDQYRGMHGAAVDPYVEEIDCTIGSSTPGRIAGFIAEPIQGYGGVIPLPDGYLSAAFERVRAAGGVCIVDEVQTGFTRTGTHFWGFEAHGVTPDIVVMGKGIGNGFPLAAVVVKRAIAESMSEKKFFNTYGANPMSCAAGRAVLRAIEEDGTRENAKEVGGYMKEKLLGLKEKHSVIGDVRGSGLMLGIDLVNDRTSKAAADEEAGRVSEYAKDNGVIIGKGGAMGNVLRINPPLCLQKEDVDLVVEVLDQGFSQL
jgi:alanine-glyoxylate transaminase/(R)-3-amino-2-methylpropionate-pyruvate transaminase